MKRISLSLFAAVLSLGLLASDADAKRLGGGSSFGMQRAPVTQRSASPSAAPSTPSKAAPATTPAPTAAAPQPAPKRSWLGPLAGLAAGVGLGALLGSAFGGGGMGGIGSVLMMLLMAGVVFFLVKSLFRRKSEQAPLSYAGNQDASAWQPAPAAPAPAQAWDVPAANSGVNGGAPSIGSDLGAPKLAEPAAEAPAPTIPAGFDTAGFLRSAKVNFHRLQAANDTCNLADLKEFTTPEIYGELKMQIDERKGVHQTTEVVELNAELLDVTTEATRHIASVRFHGTIKEEKDQPAGPFNEVWHLVKPTDGSSGWLVAGIEQLQ